ncbi:MAG: peptidylprolyl isomerase [Mariprofundales bacterium]
MIKYISLLTIPLFVLCVVVSQAQATPINNSTLLDGIAAIVNNEAISCSQIDADALALARQFNNATRTPDQALLGARVLEQRIVRILQTQRAKQLDLKVDDEAIKAAMKDVETRNSIPSGQLPKVLAAQGMDLDEYIENLRDQLLLSKLIGIDVRSKLTVSEEAMREYYRKYLASNSSLREVRLAEVFISLPPDPTPTQVAEARNKASDLRLRILQNKNQDKNDMFAQLARLYSDSPAGAQGGDLGWFLPGALPPRFMPVLDLAIGEVSLPLRSPVGFHILQVRAENWRQPASHGERYEEAHARHIVFKIPSRADANNKKRIRIRAEQTAELLSNADDDTFAMRARELSQGPSAEKGGDLGWFKRGEMAPSFDEAVFALKNGQISGVIATPFGLHIILLLEKRRVDPNAFAARRQEVEDVLINAEMQNQLPRWIAGLKKKATISTRSCPL